MSSARNFACAAIVVLASTWIVPQALAHRDQEEAQDTSANTPKIEKFDGTVDEIIVNDNIHHATYRIRELRLRDGSSIALQGIPSESLNSGSRVELIGKRVGAALDVADARPLADPATPNPKTTTFEIEGTLAVVHSDNFPAASSRYIYQIHGDNGTVRRIDIAALPTVLEPGMRISVDASISDVDNSLRPSRITILVPASRPESGGKRSEVPPKATNTVLVVLANFNDATLGSFVAADAQAIMMSNSSSVANYFNEVSFGQQSLAVTVTSQVTMAMSKPSTCGDSVWQGIGNAATAAAAAANGTWNSANYGFVVYLFPQVPSCGWNGLAYIGSPHKAYINGTNSFVTQVITHEMGHNFGLYHAGSLDCGASTIEGSCTAAEYGDPFDTMGNQRSMHYSAEQKRKLNWITASSTPTHSAGTLTYSLTPIEMSGGTTYAVKIPTTNGNRTYWVEYRQPIGFDSPLSAFPNNGAQIRVSNPFETTCSGCVSYSLDTELLDMTPGTSTFTDAALIVGQSFSDATYGVTINVLSANASALTMQVSLGGQAASTTTLTSSSNPSSYLSSVTFAASVTGNSPTGTINFRDAGVSIAGCSAVTLIGTAPAIASCATDALAVGTHAIVATYSGDAGNPGSSSSALSQVVNAVTSTTSLATSQNPSAEGSNVAFTATVSGSAPTGSITFTDGASAIPGCAPVALAGSGNIRTAVCSTTGLAVGTHSIVAAYSGDANNGVSNSAAIFQTVSSSAPSTSMNVAAAANGGTVSASSVYGSAFPVAAINDGDRSGSTWGNGGGWADSTYGVFPDWVQINFSGSKTIDRVVVYTLRDGYGSALDPSDTETFNSYGIVDFTVQVWNGANWITVASVTGNNLVKRTVTFSPTSTDRIRVNVTNALLGSSRIVELEAWGS